MLHFPGRVGEVMTTRGASKTKSFGAHEMVTAILRKRELEKKSWASKLS